MSVFGGLSGRLLILTIIVVMLAEVAIFVPSVARFRVDWLMERVRRAEIAAMTVTAAPDGMVPEALQDDLLERAEVLNVVLARDGTREMVLSRADLPPISASFDLRDASAGTLVIDAMRCLIGADAKAVFRVIAELEAMPGEAIEVTVPAWPLREAMIDYGWRILQLSLVISGITAGVVFLLVRRMVVTPILRLVRNVRRFQSDPEDPDRVIRPGSRLGEVAEAERAIESMQREVQHSLGERRRLAALGEALAKISHDLRNMLSAGQLMTDRLEMSSDPLVARVLPKLVGSLDRAINLCQRTLDYGRAEEAPPVARTVDLKRLAEEVTEGLGLGPDGDGPVERRIGVPEGMTVEADPDQLYRVLVNLARNAVEAIQASGRPGTVTIAAEDAGRGAVIRVADTGPGLPASARDNLFQPFRGGARAGGTGLGLAIARDLIEAHGGRLDLVASTTEGTVFEIVLPRREPDATDVKRPDSSLQ